MKWVKVVFVHYAAWGSLLTCVYLFSSHMLHSDLLIRHFLSACLPACLPACLSVFSDFLHEVYEPLISLYDQACPNFSQIPGGTLRVSNILKDVGNSLD